MACLRSTSGNARKLSPPDARPGALTSRRERSARSRRAVAGPGSASPPLGPVAEGLLALAGGGSALCRSARCSLQLCQHHGSSSAQSTVAVQEFTRRYRTETQSWHYPAIRGRLHFTGWVGVAAFHGCIPCCIPCLHSGCIQDSWLHSCTLLHFIEDQWEVPLLRETLHSRERYRTGRADLTARID
jgi:hypothetical protein